MKYVDNSLSVVFVGDFNRKYISFEWLATTVFEENKIEMGVNVKDGLVAILYQTDSVIIIPNQKKITFQVKGLDKVKIGIFTKYIQKFTSSVPNELFTAYGINSNYSEDESLVIPQENDSLTSQKRLIKNGYDIINMTSIRQVSKDGKVYNVTVSSDIHKTNININEDHQKIAEVPIEFDEMLKRHFECCKEILGSFGFDLEESNDE